MKKLVKTLIIPSVSVALLSGCSSLWNNAGDNPTVAEKHPISVDSQVVTLTLDVDPTTSDLSKIDQARLKAFALTYMQNGHGPMTITAPTGGADDRVAQETSSDIRRYLNGVGVPWASMSGASYRAGGSGSDRELVISYTHFVATPSPCGIWDSEVTHVRKNIAHPNFGCADQNNLAAMIADPRDLIEPAASTPPDALQRVRGVETFRSGEVTASERDATIETNVSN